MIIIKGFFRKRATKKNISIISTLIICIFVLVTCSQYYSNILTKTYKENSYFIAIGESDLTAALNNNTHIDELRKVALLDPGDVLFSDESYSSTSMLDQQNQHILVEPSNSLKDDEIIIKMPKFTLDNIDGLINLAEKNIKITNLPSNQHFKITSVERNNSNRIAVSKKIFDELITNQKYSSYIFTIDNYNTIDEFYSEFEDINIELRLVQCYSGKEKIDTIESLKKTIHILSLMCDLIFISFVILSVIIYNSIVFEEKNYMEVERTLGYSKSDAMKYLILKIFSMNFIIGGLLIIAQIVIKFMTHLFFHVNINLCSTLILSIGSIFGLSIILCVIQANQCKIK